MQTVLLSQTWLWKGKVPCSSSAMSTSRAGEKGMPATLLCLTGNQSAGGAKSHRANSPSVLAVGSAWVLCGTGEGVHRSAQKEVQGAS